MIKILKNYWLLILIVLLGAMIRVWLLDSLPSILNRDEAALAYNAVLLQETGRDEWNRAWPLALESFGDFKLPGYPLMLVGIFSLFGQSDFAVRLPSMMAGIGVIVVSYTFARKLRWSYIYSCLLALVVAVVPVFIFYSRMAFEANVGLFLTLIIIYLAYFPGKKHRLVSDIALLVITLIAVFTYNTPFLLLPFLIVLLPFRRGIKQVNSWTLAGVGLVVVWIAAAMVLLPLTSQKSGITIFSDPLVYHNFIEYRIGLNSVEASLFGSKYVYWSTLIGQHFLQSFSPTFLVIKGGAHPWHQVPGTGHVYLSMVIMSMVGAIVAALTILQTLWRRQILNALRSTEFLILYFLVISLLPSVITVDAPHATRSLLFFWTLAAVAVYGLWRIASWLQTKTTLAIEHFLVALFSLLLLVQAGWYLKTYFWEYPLLQEDLMPGYNLLLPPYSQALDVIDPGGYQYVLTAWYQQLPADVFLETIQRQPKDTIGFSYPKQMGHTHFWKNITEARENGVREALLWKPETQQWELYEVQ